MAVLIFFATFKLEIFQISLKYDILYCAVGYKNAYMRKEETTECVGLTYIGYALGY